MKTPMNLDALQRRYDMMLKVAKQSLNNDVPLSDSFEREFNQLTRLIKSMGGRV